MKNRKQFISFEHNPNKKATITCGVPQGSILGPLLFLLYVNYLDHVSKALNSIMFADNTNVLFEKMNKELTNVSNWLNANKLSLNVKKSIVFSTNHKKDNILMWLPNLNINGLTVARES